MKQWMMMAGRASAVLGVVVCLASGLARVTGSYALAGFETMTLFSVGVGLMVFAILAKLYAPD
ncbi:MAG: hypothetical protein ACOZB0_12565 [Pseudomonadota bacterium]